MVCVRRRVQTALDEAELRWLELNEWDNTQRKEEFDIRFLEKIFFDFWAKRNKQTIALPIWEKIFSKIMSGSGFCGSGEADEY